VNAENAENAEMVPIPYRVTARIRETADSVTLMLQPVSEAVPAFRPGQFTMLYAHGVGEIAVSISGDPRDPGCLSQTIRDVGAVSRALNESAPGDVIGVRGPFGTSWDPASAADRDVVIVAGGVGLAPLRPLILDVLHHRQSFRRVVLVAGARTPGDLLFRAELDVWAAQSSEAHVTIDQPARSWAGAVGFVTEPLARLRLDPGRTTAFLCGPEAMMRFCGDLLVGAGMSAHDIRLSLERNMKCGIGWCGHCQLGPLLVCRDGPVVDYALARPLLTVREL
jgi:NAD(P)H-flavin reductase